LPVEAVVDEASGQVQKEVTPHGGAGALDVEAVIEQAVEDGGADPVVVIGLGGDVEGPGAEVPAAGASGAILGVTDVEVSLLAVSQGSDTTAEGPLAPAALAAGGAGVGLGCAAHDADTRREHGLCSLGNRE
jgi:hypothetical protein